MVKSIFIPGIEQYVTVNKYGTLNFGNKDNSHDHLNRCRKVFGQNPTSHYNKKPSKIPAIEETYPKVTNTIYYETTAITVTGGN